MNITFREIAEREAEEAYGVVCEVTGRLLGKGITQWRRPLPRDVYEKRQQNGFNYGLWVDGKVAGVVSLTDDRPKYWKDELPRTPFVWLTSLATRVKFKGRGLGRRLLECADKHVWEAGMKRICLGCCFGSGFLPRYYSEGGYAAISRKVLFGKKEFDSALMPKELKSSEQSMQAMAGSRA